MRLIFLVAMAVLVTPAISASPAADERYVACVRLAQSDAPKAIAEAEAWRDAGGGIAARQCLGLAYVAAERWLPAAVAFEQAAREAEIHRDTRAATLWVQSGNASLAAGEAVKARLALDRALDLGIASSAMRGEALVDRARAAVEAGDRTAARTDLDAALRLVPGDPMAWLLSAALARREGQFDRAQADIAEAGKLAADDPDIAAEKARIEEMRGDPKPANETRP